MTKVCAHVYLSRLFSTLLFTLCFVSLTQVYGQNSPGVKKADAKAGIEKGKWHLSASKTNPQTFSVKAHQAPLADVVNEFSKILKVPFNISPSMSGQVIDLDVSNLALEPTLRLLAPKVYVDYEVGGGMTQPKLLGVFLHNLTDKQPSPHANIKHQSETILIEGDTEEGTEEYEKRKEVEEQELKVRYENNQLSVVARKKPLVLVLYKIASELNIPFDLRYESAEVINVDFKNYPLDVAIRNLAPVARLYYRADLQTSEIQPVRIAVVAPASAITQTKP